MTELSVISKLNDEQEAALASFVRDWSAVSRSVPADRPQVQSVIDSIYRGLGLPAPAILWCRSLWQFTTFPAMLYLACSENGASLFEAFRSELREPLWKTMWSDLIDQIGSRDQLLRAVTASFSRAASNPESAQLLIQPIGRTTFPSRSSLLEPLFGDSVAQPLSLHLNQLLGRIDSIVSERLGIQAQIKLRDALYTGFRGANRAELIRQNFGLRLNAVVGNSLPSELKSQTSEKTFELIERICIQKLAKDEGRFGVLGQRPPIEALFAHQLSSAFALELPEWFPVFAFLEESFKLDLESALSECIINWLILKRNVLQIDSYSRLCIVCEYPRSSNLDERRRLHSDTGPAMEFWDGFKIHAIDGVVVPGEVVTAPDTLSVQQIDGEPNIEVRRIMVRRFGLERYLREANAVEIDSDAFGTLYKKEQRNDEPIVVVKVKDSTPNEHGEHREYFLRVPPSIRTARQAIAWTFNLGQDEYVPTQQS